MDKLTKSDIEAETYFGKQLYDKTKKKIEAYESDITKDKRLSVRKCKTCHYLRSGVMAGQGFTSSTCRNCGKEIINPSTNTDKICSDCSDKLNICVKCGGKID